MKNILLYLLSFSSMLTAQTIELANKAEITAPIIAQTESYIVVDFGFSPITISREYIVSISENNQIMDANSLEHHSKDDSSTFQQKLGEIYYTNNSYPMTLEENVNQAAEAVVLVSQPYGLGSGFFINEKGYLITNYHVIEGETKIKVTVFKKDIGGFEKIKFEKVKIVAFNPFLDLALLKVEDIENQTIKFVPLGDSDRLNVGEQVFAVGNPLGLERSVHNGIVSSLNRAFEGLVYIQTNTDINPGNSGGPLFNMNGQVIGVTNMGYVFMGGLGFAIPINYVKTFIDNYEAFAYDKDNPNTGYRYIQPSKKENKTK